VNRRIHSGGLALAAALFFSLASSLGAQSVRGVLVERQGGAPVAGALVAILDEGEVVKGEVLSDSTGAFLLRAPSAGRYALRAQRIGYAPSTSPPLELREGQTTEYRMTASVERVMLPAITTTATRECAGPGDPDVVTLWDEASKALLSAAHTQAQFPYVYRVRRGVRLLDAASMLTRSENVQTYNREGGMPFQSLPAEQLAEHGYVVATGDTTTFYAPDAFVLLSGSFLATHCFHTEAGDRDHAGLVGLGFAPTGAAQSRADVQGVLWLDAQTAELKVLEYGYAGNVGRSLPEGVGGRVEFRRLPNGTWIVSRWRIRMPAGESRSRSTPGAPIPGVMMAGQAGLVEELGEVVALSLPGQVMSEVAARSTVSGVVYDSTRSRPLAGATVSLAGTDRTAKTDSAGRYEITRVAEGVYSLGFSHPRLDSLRFSPDPVRVSVAPPANVARDLAIPPLAVVLTVDCPPMPGTGALAGIVTLGGEGRPLQGVPLRAAWQRPGASGDTAHALAVTDETGAYRFCGLPLQVPVTIAALRAGAGEPVQVRLAGAPAQRDLVMAEAPHLAAGAAASGRARVVVRLVDASSSRPIAGAKVRFGRGLPEVRSDRNGQAVLQDVPPGTYGVEFESETYGSGTSRVAVTEGREVRVELRIPLRPVKLEPIAVVARREVRDIFDPRRSGRKLNLIDRTEIDSRGAAVRNIVDLVRSLPGIRVKYESCVEATRTPQGGGALAENVDKCTPVALFLDDQPVDYQNIEQIPMDVIESVVFLTPTEAFGRYGFIGQTGVLLVYTRGNGPTGSHGN
jgi:hypothetical protein